MKLPCICVQEVLSLDINGNIGYPEGNHSIHRSMRTIKILLKLARIIWGKAGLEYLHTYSYIGL
jgi:hypothetical protein